jgi:rhodanese-related sulfurtransferase
MNMSRSKVRGSAGGHKADQGTRTWIAWVVIGLIVLIAIATAVASLRRASQTTIILPAVINADTAYTYYQKNEVIIVDVRATKDWKMYHITDSKSIPLADLPNHLNELPAHAAIIVVDDYFDLSPQGRDLLLKDGYTNVSALDGGILAWAVKGYPVVGLVPY